MNECEAVEFRILLEECLCLLDHYAPQKPHEGPCGPESGCDYLCVEWAQFCSLRNKLVRTIGKLKETEKPTLPEPANNVDINDDETTEEEDVVTPTQRLSMNAAKKSKTTSKKHKKSRKISEAFRRRLIVSFSQGGHPCIFCGCAEPHNPSVNFHVKHEESGSEHFEYYCRECDSFWTVYLNFKGKVVKIITGPSEHFGEDVVYTPDDLKKH